MPTLDAERRSLFTGVLRNKQLDFAGSERDLAVFLQNGHATLRDRALVAEIRGDNAAKTFHYAEAAKWYGSAVQLSDSLRPGGKTSPGNSAGTSNEEDFTSDAQLWHALAGLHPQELQATSAVRVAGQRDKAGLLRLPVEMGSRARSVDAVFDTGADVTTLARSLADAVGVSYPSRDSLQVDGVAARTWGRVAVIPVVHIGAATLTDVPVLVLPDSALAFPAAHYAIQAILGLPVIRAFGRVTISATDSLVLGPPTAREQLCESSHGNLMLDGLKLLVDVTVNGTHGAYTFDTGANSTTFYPYFGTTHAALIVTATHAHARYGGAGGSVSTKALLVGPVNLAIGRSVVRLSRVPVLNGTGPLTPGSHIEGNLGQDVLRGLGAVTIDFDRCTISGSTSTSRT